MIHDAFEVPKTTYAAHIRTKACDWSTTAHASYMHNLGRRMIPQGWRPLARPSCTLLRGALHNGPPNRARFQVIAEGEGAPMFRQTGPSFCATAWAA
eukprot:8497234-Pyramimonas_sp.AAC.1